MEGPVGVMGQLETLRSVVAILDPVLLEHLTELGADNFMFAFRMLLVQFRRELPLPDAMCLWEVSFVLYSTVLFCTVQPRGRQLHACVPNAARPLSARTPTARCHVPLGGEYYSVLCSTEQYSTVHHSELCTLAQDGVDCIL